MTFLQRVQYMYGLDWGTLTDSNITTNASICMPKAEELPNLDKILMDVYRAGQLHKWDRVEGQKKVIQQYMDNVMRDKDREISRLHDEVYNYRRLFESRAYRFY